MFIEDDHLLNSRNEIFDELIDSMDIVLNSLSGDKLINFF